ncbi:MAG: hypothetical protein PHS34_08140 [Candidatus Omnitrophica bacterium]|nr:hypothetical protein [Candidatus Nanoarchaeia archaeon]MDD5551213.1 hypothetical protein [Candidatus Omnitrophota bacterium]
MVVYTYEKGVHINNIKDFEKSLNTFVDKILTEYHDRLAEVVFTTDVKTALSTRMVEDEYQRWLWENEFTYLKTCGKTFRSRNDNTKYAIVLYPIAGIFLKDCFTTNQKTIPVNSNINQNDMIASFCHEVIHVYWNVYFDNNTPMNLTDIQMEKIDNLNDLVSEYDACRIEESIHRQIKNESMVGRFNISKEMDKLIQECQNCEEMDFTNGSKKFYIALGEFNSIFTRAMGYYEGANEYEKLEQILGNEKFNIIFEDVLINMSKLLRDFVKDNTIPIVDVAENLDKLGWKQRDTVLSNIGKTYKQTNQQGGAQDV